VSIKSKNKIPFEMDSFVVMYDNGQGVLQDYALAHMWFNLSGSNGDKIAVKNRDIIEKKMSKQQIEKAQ
jgi:uncharacterized protein